MTYAQVQRRQCLLEMKSEYVGIIVLDDIVDLPPNSSGKAALICFLISRSFESSGVSRARRPYRVTLRWLSSDADEL